MFMTKLKFLILIVPPIKTRTVFLVLRKPFSGTFLLLLIRFRRSVQMTLLTVVRVVARRIISPRRPMAVRRLLDWLIGCRVRFHSQLSFQSLLKTPAPCHGYTYNETRKVVAGATLFAS